MRTGNYPTVYATPAMEWKIVQDQVKRRPAEFIARLERNIRREGECRLWIGGSVTEKGYARTTFYMDRKQYIVYVHRLFLVMQIKGPIPKGKQAGHDHTVCPYPNCVKHVRVETADANLRERNERHARQKATAA